MHMYRNNTPSVPAQPQSARASERLLSPPLSQIRHTRNRYR